MSRRFYVKLKIHLTLSYRPFNIGCHLGCHLDLHLTSSVNAPQGKRKVEKSGVSSRGMAVKFWFCVCVCLWATSTTPPLVICGLNFPFKKYWLTCPKSKSMGVVGTSPLTVGNFGGNQIGQLGFLQICNRSFFLWKDGVWRWRKWLMGSSNSHDFSFFLSFAFQWAMWGKSNYFGGTVVECHFGFWQASDSNPL